MLYSPLAIFVVDLFSVFNDKVGCSLLTPGHNVKSLIIPYVNDISPSSIDYAQENDA